MSFRLMETGEDNYIPLDATELQIIIKYFLKGRRRVQLGIKIVTFIANTLDMSGERYLQEIMPLELEESTLKSLQKEDRHNGY